MLKEQQTVLTSAQRIVQVFKSSQAKIRPHFILTGPSGCGKSHLVQYLAEVEDLHFIEVNAAQLTREGTSGNSLSKALSPLRQAGGAMTICFVDEFDKLFISGNTNSEMATESTTSVQNEFLKVLEGRTTQVFGDYGKYVDTPVDNVLFVFAGAFNGESDLTIDRLRSFGIKTEFLGRVGLLFNMTRLSLESMRLALEDSQLLKNYLKLMPTIKAEAAINDIMEVVSRNYEMNTLGIRMLNTLIHQYFIGGGQLPRGEADRVTFQTLNFAPLNKA